MTEELLTQTEARKQARDMNERGDLPSDELVAIAQPVPAGSWGGHERGWTVTYVSKKAYR